MKQTAPSVSPMSNEARNSYVIEQITRALTGLLRAKPIGEVSISELCAAAGVGRAFSSSFFIWVVLRIPNALAISRSCMRLLLCNASKSCIRRFRNDKFSD